MYHHILLYVISIASIYKHALISTCHENEIYQDYNIQASKPFVSGNSLLSCEDYKLLETSCLPLEKFIALDNNNNELCNSLCSLRLTFFTFPTSEYQTSSYLAKELAARGNNVTIMVPNKKSSEIPYGVNHYDMTPVTTWEKGFEDAARAVLLLPAEGSKDFYPLIKSTMDKARYIYELDLHKYFTEMEKQNTLPNACVFTWLMEPMWHFCSDRGIPIITQNPSILMAPLLVRHASRPVEDIFSLDYPGRRPTNPRGRTVAERLFSLLAWTFITHVVPLGGRYSATANVPIRRYSGIANVPIGRYSGIANVPFTLQLVHTTPGFDFAADLSPLTQYTGPLLPSDIFDVSRLSQNVLTFLFDSQKMELPVIYVSFGTLVRLPEANLKAIYSGLKSLSGIRWRALWSYDLRGYNLTSDASEGDTSASHVMVVKWTHGPATVAHPAVKLLLNHCGANGINEALSQSKPVLGIPVFGDQTALCDRLLASGAGRTLCHYEATPDVIQNVLLEMLDNYYKYKIPSAKLSLAMKAMGGLNKAADLVELVTFLGHENVTNMWRSAAEFDGPFKTYSFDIGLCLLILACLLGCVLVKPFSRLFVFAYQSVLINLLYNTRRMFKLYKMSTTINSSEYKEAHDEKNIINSRMNEKEISKCL